MQALRNEERTGMVRRWWLMTVAMLTVVALVSLGGCNTMEGAGEDIESGGEAIQRAAD